MKKSEQVLQGKPIRIYHLQHRLSYYYFVFFWSLIALIFLIAFVDKFLIDILPGSRGVPWYTGPAFLISMITCTVLAWRNYWRARNTRLCIYSWGIHYDEFEYSMTTMWDNIKRISPGPAQRLILKEAVAVNRRFSWLGPMKPEDDSIPLWSFWPKVIGNNMERDLRKYLPHLFENLSIEKSKK
ncbi:MAG: hypothetical protein R6X32_16105 [Chloroflexota bacterium]|jgi:hypothetical protein